jgi:hypothetical protein
MTKDRDKWLASRSQKTCSVCRTGIAVRTRVVPPKGSTAKYVYQCTNPKCKAKRKI